MMGAKRLDVITTDDASALQGHRDLKSKPVLCSDDGSLDKRVSGRSADLPLRPIAERV